MHPRVDWFSVLLCSGILFAGIDTKAQQRSKAPSANWTKGPADRFVGDVWVEYFVNDTTADFLASRVQFESNARSNWHFHSGKQIIFAIEGEGYYKEKGKPIKILKKGEVVVIEPGTVHSHGSAHSKKFTQGVMMNDIGNPKSTTWLTAYLFIAAMVEKRFGKKWSVVLNGENLLDYRQSRVEPLYTGSITNPTFVPLWAPIDGRVINLSVKFNMFHS
jgi:quercetin dioxygenase-like cupin family protein